MTIGKVKDKLQEYMKLEQKVKLLENKYVFDIASMKQMHEQEAKGLNREINNKQKYVLAST